MKNNQYMEYTILNPKNGKYHQFVMNDDCDIIQIFNKYLEVDEPFESEAYHLVEYAKNNGLILHLEIKEFSSIEQIKKSHNIL